MDSLLNLLCEGQACSGTLGRHFPGGDFRRLLLFRLSSIRDSLSNSNHYGAPEANSPATAVQIGMAEVATDLMAPDWARYMVCEPTSAAGLFQGHRPDLLPRTGIEAAMDTKTIVLGGNGAFQMPRWLVNAVPITFIDGRACKLLLWILWEAHAKSRWPAAGQEPEDMLVRYHAQDMLAGVGLKATEGYAGIRDALGQITALRYHGLPDPLVPSFIELPGPHFDVLLSAELAALHARPLGQYGLLNMDHVRQLKTPLDISLYARACHVARARQPQFEIMLDEIACLCGTTQQVSWRTLRRQLLDAITRVCAATGGRVHVQGWCSGDRPGVDRLRCHVSVVGAKVAPRCPPRHGAIYFDVQSDGPRRLAGRPAACNS